jgi:hypothetical protein
MNIDEDLDRILYDLKNPRETPDPPKETPKPVEAPAPEPIKAPVKKPIKAPVPIQEPVKAREPEVFKAPVIRAPVSREYLKQLPFPADTRKIKKNVKKLWDISFSDDGKEKPEDLIPDISKPNAAYNQAPPKPYQVGSELGDHDLSLMLAEGKSASYFNMSTS